MITKIIFEHGRLQPRVLSILRNHTRCGDFTLFIFQALPAGYRVISAFSRRVDAT